MQLVTERFLLRDFIQEDWVQVHAYCSDAEVTRYTFWGPNTVEQTREFLDTITRSQNDLLRTLYELAIVELSSGKVIGNCCLKIEKSNAELGYCISKAHWGKGVATEVAQSLLQFGFQELGLHRIYATCRPENTGSWMVMEKIGMNREGHLREHFSKEGKWQDSYLYSVLRHEFESRIEQRERASWYSAQLLFKSEVTNDPNYYDTDTYEESIILTKARSKEEALHIATNIGKVNEHGYTNMNNGEVFWRFIKVINVFDTSEKELDSGAEIFSRFILVPSGTHLEEVLHRFYQEE